MINKHNFLVISVIAMALLLGACASVQLGHDFDLQTFENRVQYGVTTRAQVHEWLGDPRSTGIAVDVDGRRYNEWTYLTGAGHLPGMKDARFKVLQIKFDEQGIVRGYEYTKD